MTALRTELLAAFRAGFIDGWRVFWSPLLGWWYMRECHRLRAELERVRAERDELHVQVTEWELTAVREGLLCRGDIE